VVGHGSKGTPRRPRGFVCLIVEMSSRAAKIREFMTASPLTIAPEELVSEARRLMAEAGIRHLPVTRGGTLVGIVSDRDVNLIEALAADQAFGGAVPTVLQAMTEMVFTCGPEAHIHAVAEEMAHDRHGSAVVVDPSDGRTVLGVFTTTDALRALARFAPHG
jgi:acetoin utilization protein AcuB